MKSLIEESFSLTFRDSRKFIPLNHYNVLKVLFIFY